jgi:YegS/Rv2252/BmrU family lipid kinase
MHCKKATLVINPRTGQNLAKITDVLAVLAAAGWQTELALKEYGGHSMELANQAAGDKCDLVIAYGGDGTVNQVINGVMTAKKPHSVVGVMPGGTANLWAGDIGVPNDPVQAALALINSEPRKVDIGYVAVQEITFPDGRRIAINGKKRKISRKARHHFLLMAGLGLDAAVMSGVSKSLKYRLGPLAVGLSAAKELPGQAPFPIEIRAASDSNADDLLWQGEALQVVVGNTRRYAIVLEMTPDAYIDDGVLDVCVITEGNPLTTMQQLSSLLLRRKPDNVTTETFRGAHLSIKVPASVLLELDGSPIKLKDYLSKSEYEAVQQSGVMEHVMITYRFDSLPKALNMAIPCTYGGELFEHYKGSHEGHVDGEQHDGAAHEEKKDNENEEEQSPLQRHTISHEAQSEQEHDDMKHGSRADEQPEAIPELVSALLEHGYEVSVVAKAPNPNKPPTYIVAGTTTKPSTGEAKPVAVVIGEKTTVFNREGQRVSEGTVKDLHAGSTIVVEGKKSKRGVIQATRAVM